MGTGRIARRQGLGGGLPEQPPAQPRFQFAVDTSRRERLLSRRAPWHDGPMKALHITSHGPIAALRPVEIPSPPLRDGEVRVRIEAAAVNPSDVLSAEGRFPHAVLPRVLGRDFAGRVVEGPAELLGRRRLGYRGRPRHHPRRRARRGDRAPGQRGLPAAGEPHPGAGRERRRAVHHRLELPGGGRAPPVRRDGGRLGAAGAVGLGGGGARRGARCAGHRPGQGCRGGRRGSIGAGSPGVARSDAGDLPAWSGR